MGARPACGMCLKDPQDDLIVSSGGGGEPGKSGGVNEGSGKELDGGHERADVGLHGV